MYFRFFNEHSFYILPVNLRQHIDNLVHAEAVVYQ